MLAALEMLVEVFFAGADEVAEGVVVLRPVHDGNVAGVGTGREVGLVDNAAVEPEVQLVAGGDAFRVEAELFRFQGFGVGIGEVEQPARPWFGHFGDVILPEIIFARLFDHVVFARAVVDRVADGECLHVFGIGLFGGVEFAGLGLGFGAGDVFGAGHGQQVAELGGVRKIGRGEGYLGFVAAIEGGERLYFVAFHVRGNDFMFQKQCQLAGAEVGIEQVGEDSYGHAWFVAELGYRSVAGVEVFAAFGLGGERVVLLVILAHGRSEVPVSLRCAVRFDPLVLVRRDALLGDLPADPVGFFGKDYREAIAQCGQCGRAAAESAASDDEVGG